MVVWKFTKKFGSKIINRQYFHGKTGLQCLMLSIKNCGELRIYYLDPSQLPSLLKPYCDVPPSPSLEVESVYVLGGPSLHIRISVWYIDGGQNSSCSPAGAVMPKQRCHKAVLHHAF